MIKWNETKTLKTLVLSRMVSESWWECVEDVCELGLGSLFRHWSFGWFLLSVRLYFGLGADVQGSVCVNPLCVVVLQLVSCFTPCSLFLYFSKCTVSILCVKS